MPVDTGKRRKVANTERSARTRDQVVDATIACLVEFGYAGLTTRRIAAAAGLTRGAQQHHFSGKAAMVSEALVRLARRASDEMATELASPPAERTTEAILDALWRMHRSPLFEAGLELWVAARTDAELRSALENVEQSLIANVAETVQPLFTEAAAVPEFAQRLEDALAAMRGLAMRGTIAPDDARLERRWHRMRPWLAAHLRGADAPPQPG